MPKLVPKHPLAVRATHWVNGPVLLVMIWSGMLIYWAYDPYHITVGGVTLVKFFPEWFYDRLDLDAGLATGMAWHFTFMWSFALIGLFYVASSLYSGYWRHLMPTRRTPVEALHVMLYDLRLRKDLPPQGLFNAAQKLAYLGVIGMGAGSVLTGLAIYKPTQLWFLTAAFGGYQTARLIHFALTVGYVLFFVVHVAQVAKAGWNNFRGMVAGYSVEPSDSTPGASGHEPARPDVG